MSLTLQATVPQRDVAVALEVADGETLALIGPNGAGKSTVLSLLAGALRPASGRIVLDGQELTGDGAWVPPHRRRIATLSQDPVLFPHLSVLGNVRFALRAQGTARAQARSEARRWLGELDLLELSGRRPSQLSGGQAQRAAIARALAASPRLLLLDEPMAALDVDVAPVLREQLRRSLAHRTALIVTHDLLDALTLADRIVVLERGRILETGPTAEVLGRPRSAFAARFAGLNLLHGTWDGRQLRLATGEVLPAHSDLPAGTAVHAVFRPAAARLVGTGGLTRIVRSLAPRGDLIRVLADDLAADLPPQEVAARRLAPGATVTVAVAAESVTTYRS
ncbi:sulfate/molybdate ABC transporter ATP-binding protein [Brachybacterium sp. UNK5269]|uniref:sulfate/molybdate ABC transporter ATP-binding protein n=1 Tax=Brachybacterium sp. UNK5269 TaxID=3408576 RepID=UPI003BAE2395